jgi:Zn-finger nucleic acid-binding protein
VGLSQFTVFAVAEEDTSKRYAIKILADSPEDAEKRAVREALHPITVAAVVQGFVLALDRENPDLTPIHRKGYETRVAKVLVSYTKFRVPSECPKCKADLHQYERSKRFEVDVACRQCREGILETVEAELDALERKRACGADTGSVCGASHQYVSLRETTFSGGLPALISSMMSRAA